MDKKMISLMQVAYYNQSVKCNKITELQYVYFYHDEKVYFYYEVIKPLMFT